MTMTVVDAARLSVIIDAFADFVFSVDLGFVFCRFLRNHVIRPEAPPIDETHATEPRMSSGPKMTIDETIAVRTAATRATAAVRAHHSRSLSAPGLLRPTSSVDWKVKTARK